MAKKKENTGTGKEEGKTVKPNSKKKAAPGKASSKPEKSGKVKGPMGVGGKKKKETTAKAKKPAKLNQPAKGRFSEQKTPEAGEVPKSTAEDRKTPGSNEKAESFPQPKKALPEKTSDSEEHMTVRNPEEHLTVIRRDKETGTSNSGGTALASEEKPRKKKRATSAKKPAASAKTSAEKRKTTPKASEDKADSSVKKTSEEKATKPPAKKMSRRKPVKGISAEEKTKLPNTSASEDLKETAKATAKDLADKILPDEKTREQMEETAKSLLPDQEDIKRTVKNFAENIAPDPEKLNKMAEKAIPDEKTREKAKKAASKAKDAVEGLMADQEQQQEKSTSEKPVEATLLSEFDVHLFKEGKHFHLYKKFGSHLMEYLGTEGVYFSLWAPNARQVHIIGDFNNWDKQSHPMVSRTDESGIWEAFVPEAKNGSLYKYFIQSTNGYEAEKGDPFAFLWENPPNTASVVWDLKTTWNDTKWLEQRQKNAQKAKPMSVYELHIGSWKRVPEEGGRSLSYREMAEDLPRYLNEMGFTHVEFMPVMEHPFFGSWGYQITGYFAPSSRFGTPQDFMHLIDALHQAEIGVILDWVPSHFPSDLHGLHYFDGTFLYEHADKKKGFHPDWQSYIFNYGRNEVRSFLISNALFWLDKFHADGLRVDAVASMLYLDYSRKEGEWEPNEEGGRENLEAISFLKEFNEVVYKEFPDAVTIAEESTAWPMVSKPTYMGGLGFGMKWMMGWMHDTLEYFKKDPIHRRHHQNTITFSTTYAFSENFMLPLSHDEVVYGKQAMINKMPGDEWNKFANLRSLYAYMYAHPGTKLLFMGAEFGQTSEWNHDSSLDWHTAEERPHQQLQNSLRELNNIYKSEPALFEKAFESDGFEWVDINDSESSIISFLRKGDKKEDNLLVVCNFTPVPRENYRIGIEEEGNWREIFNSDEEQYGGSGVKNEEAVEAKSFPTHGRDFSLALTLPPMAVIYLKQEKLVL